MPHDDKNQQQPRQPTTHETQQGVGQGTADRRRRPPRTKVDDVGIAEASGLSLGVDGFPHPIETDAEGNLRTKPKDVASLLEELIILQKATVAGIAIMLDYQPQTLIDLVDLFD